MRQFKLLLLLSLVHSSHVQAAITTIAMSGDNVPGIPGAEFDFFDVATINSSGNVVFTANLTHDLGGISSANDQTLLVSDEAEVSMVAQEGSGNVPGVTGANFGTFLDIALDDSGTVAARASLSTPAGGVTTSNNQGIWQFGVGGNTLVTRTGSDIAPGAPARFQNIANQFITSNNGKIAFEGTLLSESGVSTANNVGVWKYQGSTGTLVARESGAAPGVPAATFGSFTPTAINANDQIAVTGVLKLGFGVSDSNKNGIWRYDGAIGQLIARTGVGNVPGVEGASFSSLSDPIMNASGQVAFHAQLTTGEQGLWKYTETSGVNLALTGMTNVPGVPDATFSIVRPRFLTNDGQVVSAANLNIGPGGVTSEDDFGLWLFQDDSSGQLLLRGGAGNVPEISGASFEDFEFYALADEGVLVQAILDVGPGGVTEANNHGIWHIPLSGEPELILRDGDELLGRTMQYVEFPTTDGMDLALRDVSNAAGQFVFRAHFSDGDSGLFLYTPDSSTEFAPTDFNTDGFVDGADLDTWSSAYGSSNAADADDDGDTDGADFLIWQRQYTGSASSLVVALPEPSVPLLIAIALVASQYRTRIKPCYNY